MTQLERQTLLIDADDTLWENNVYFERAIARFMEMVAPDPETRPAVREIINREERRTIAECGYGLESFQLAIGRAFRAVAPERWNPAAEAAIGALAASIASEPIEFVPGAEATLRYLSARHRLILMTKGDFAEQSRKVALSGIGPLFEQVHVVAEKNTAAYEEKLTHLDSDPLQSWMIGNSPKSDINPALAAGLNAVFIPHPWTWVLEHDEILPQPGRQCLHLERFTDLQLHF
ncbi:MAG TPA: HAD family hydrolase [Terriglobales bacterium]|nr:HAD family hydrolase [Terriglobales bacterium]